MPVKILGVSAFYHDAAAAIVEDGDIIAAAQEERFSRMKHDARLPVHAMNYCLEEARTAVDALDGIAFYENAVLRWDRVIQSAAATGEPCREQFRQAARSVLGTKVWAQSLIGQALGGLGKAGKLLTVEHHLSHAGSAFYPSPFEEAAIVTLDGVGEWATTTIGMGERNHIELLLEIDYPHSLGLLYSAFTYFCGFAVNDGEYKVMGLAPYGRPIYAQLILDRLISVKPDGSYRLNIEYFGYVAGTAMTNEKFDSLFGGPRRLPGSKITRREMDLAASIQAVLELVVLRIVAHARKQTGARHLVMAGGVALNCVVNGKIVESGIFERVWIQPAGGDAGGALGAALVASHEYFGAPRLATADGRDGQKGSYLGPAFGAAEVRAFLDRHQLPYQVASDQVDVAAAVAHALAAGKIVGYFHGRMEFGPRALGARSILADPRNPEMQSIVNDCVKHRESFRPFAPAVLQERVEKFFDFAGESPYMLLVTGIRKHRRIRVTPDLPENEDLNQTLRIPRSDLPAVTHVDYTARVQTIRAQDQPDFREVVKAFENLTGYGVVLNTSFNTSDEPIVCSPRDAYACFMRTGIDLLVLEDCLLWKHEQPEFTEEPTANRAAAGQTCPAGDHGALIDQLFETVLRCRDAFGDQGAFAAAWPCREASSFYVARKAGRPSPDAFLSAAYEDEAGFASAIRQIWQTNAGVGLEAVVEESARLAGLLANSAQIQDGRIPSTLYVMF